MVEQQGGTTESTLSGHVIDDHRVGREQGIAGLRFEPGRDGPRADQPLAPADPGAEPQLLAVGQQFQDLAEVDVQHLGDDPDGLVHQGVGVRIGEGPLAEPGDGPLLLLADAVAFGGPPQLGHVEEGGDDAHDAAVGRAVGQDAAEIPAAVGVAQLALGGTEAVEDLGGFLGQADGQGRPDALRPGAGRRRRRPGRAARWRSG